MKKHDDKISIEIDGVYCPKCNDMHPTLMWHEKYNDYISKTKHVDSIIKSCKIFGVNISLDTAYKNYAEHLNFLGIDETEIIKKCVMCSAETRFKNIKTNNYVCSNKCRYADDKKHNSSEIVLEVNELFGIKKIFENLNYEVIDTCLSNDEIMCFERNNKITFPEQYREFLLYIGNGVKFKNGNIIKGIKRPIEKQFYKRIQYRFLFKEGWNEYLHISPKAYPRYDDRFPQYEDCVDPVNLESGCKECPHYMECIDTCYDENLLYDQTDNAYFNGCYDISGAFYLVVTGDSKNQIWHAAECDSGVFNPAHSCFYEYVQYVAKEI